MNRRKFLKSCVIASFVAPTVTMSLIPKPELEVINGGHNYIDIFTVDELKSYGIRSATYCASVVDKNGVFAHEPGFLDWDWTKPNPGPKINEPFIRKTFVLKSLPKIYEENKKCVDVVLGKMRSGLVGPGSWMEQKVIDEIKEHMEYVCLVVYAQAPCLCGRDTCPKHWIPIVGGMSKKRYERHLRELNE
jgi:hypothetical protein